MLIFGDFRLDPLNQELRRGPDLISLPPKAFALLSYQLMQYIKKKMYPWETKL